MPLLSRIAMSAALTVAIPGAIALGLIASNGPVSDLRVTDDGLDFSTLHDAAPAPLIAYTARDGATLGFRRWDSGLSLIHI